MFKDGNQAKIEYPKEDSMAEVAGRSFHNGALNIGKCLQRCPQLNHLMTCVGSRAVY